MVSHPTEEARRSLHHARRVVIKAGTTMLTHCDGNMALGRIGALVEQIAMLRMQGREVVLVTSGAISTGQHRMRRTMTLQSSIRDSLSGKAPEVDPSATAAVGQALLMNMYDNLFAKYNMTCAQVLVTEDDMADGETLANVTDMNLELLSLGVVPIVNDNDAVTARKVPVYNDATNEVRWDNDCLASTLATSLRADLLIMLTDMDSLYTPAAAADSAQAVRIPHYKKGVEVTRTGMAVDSLLSDGGRGKFAGATRHSQEGLDDLLQAATTAVEGGVRAAVITTGHHPLSLIRVVRGDDVGTLFTRSSASAPSSKL